MTQQTDTSVEVRVTVDAPIEKAFAVFTERFDTWWPRGHHLGEGDLDKVVIEPREGGRWYERTTDAKECDWGRVLVWDPPEHLALSWDIVPDFTGVDHDHTSRVDVRFTAETPTRTTVTLVHSDFDKHGDGWQAMRESVSHEGGWRTLLETYAATVKQQ